MKYYLFDFDGTLVDSMPTYAAMMLRILDENKISYGDDIIKIITYILHNRIFCMWHKTSRSRL